MNKSVKIQHVKGMNDVLPDDSFLWQQFESMVQAVFSDYGYRQIRTPLVEKTELFERSIGLETDIVNKEMYTFPDRNDLSLTLRPEGTASCVRAGIEHGLLRNQKHRVWYMGPMFRYEKPQKGRYRQFHQIGLECYGWQGADIEAEVLAVSARLFRKLGLRGTRLEINCLGDAKCRDRYLSDLVGYLREHEGALDADSKRRLRVNPLRIFDSKDENVRTIMLHAPSILDHISDESRLRFEQLQSFLNDLEIQFTINPMLVRGLDYYNDLVFEWIQDDYAAQATICGGGRYDHLVEQLGGVSTPGIGFAMGCERLIQILQSQPSSTLKADNCPDIYLISVGQTARRQALQLHSKLLDNGLSCILHCGEEGMKNQFKQADRVKARLAMVIGEDEATTGSVGIKPLREKVDQMTISQAKAPNKVTNLLKSL